MPPKKPQFTLPNQSTEKEQSFFQKTVQPLSGLFDFGKNIFNKISPYSKFLPPTIPGVKEMQGIQTGREITSAIQQPRQPAAPVVQSDMRSSTPKIMANLQPPQQPAQPQIQSVQPAPPQAPQAPAPEQPQAPQNQFDAQGRQIDTSTGQPVVSRPEQPEAPTQPQVPTDPIEEAQNIVSAAPPEQQQAGAEAVTAAESAYMKSLEISPDELSTQADLDRLIEATKKGYRKIEGQTIPLEALVGQLGLVEDRATDLAEPLENKMARLQAKRLATQGASKFALEREDKKATRLRDEKVGELKEINGNLYRITPDGKAELIVEGTADAGDQFTLGEGQERYDAEGNLIAQGPPETTDPLADRKKQLEIQKLEKGLEESVGGGYSAQIAERTISTIDTAIADFAEVSGVLGAYGRTAASKVLGTDSYNFAQTLETIKANIGFNELNAMRAASKTGGALGQVSERELTYLQSVLGSLAIGQSDERLLQNLKNVKDSINRWTDAVKEEGGGGDGEVLILDGVEYIDDGTGNYSPKANGGSGAALTVTLPNGQTHEGGSASWRNNNPLNIKFGSFAQGYNSTQGSKATDGGSFAAFDSIAEGLTAARDLLKGASYNSLPLEKAMQRWSGNGYGADVAPANLQGKTISQMTDSEITQLINAMSTREGWRQGKVLT